ncbi:MAG: pseudouridine synthase, partial [Rikenellaceae bacterium]
DRDGFKPRGDRDGFKPRGDRDGFKPRGDRDGFKPREDRGGFAARDERRDDRRGFAPKREFVELTPEQRAEKVEIAKRKEAAAEKFRIAQREANGSRDIKELGEEVDRILSGKDSEQKRENTENRISRREKPIDKEMRLNRFVAQSGVCSRRDADLLIEQGLVTVNGEVVTEFGSKVNPAIDTVEYNGKKLSGEKKVYIIMNKPKGFVTSVDDPHNDKVVIDLLGTKVPQRVYPVGRLDKETTGVLLLTNDGDLTKELTHPSYEHKKIYHVFLDKPCNTWDLEALANGIELEDGEIHADEISYVEGNKKEIGIELHSGRNRIVRRMFEHLGYRVEKLDRVYFAGFSKMGLRRSHWRHLTPREVTNLLSQNYKKKDR